MAPNEDMPVEVVDVMVPGGEAPAGSSGEDVCPKCDSSDKADGETCPNCDGTGRIVRRISGAEGTATPAL
jgi:DnaJ-class molecular chaperone